MSPGLSSVGCGGKSPCQAQASSPRIAAGSLSFWLSQHHPPHHPKRRADGLCSQPLLGQLCVSAVLLHPVGWKITL